VAEGRSANERELTRSTLAGQLFRPRWRILSDRRSGGADPPVPLTIFRRSDHQHDPKEQPQQQAAPPDGSERA
jgi:hypothetical protein